MPDANGENIRLFLWRAGGEPYCEIIFPPGKDPLEARHSAIAFFRDDAIIQLFKRDPANADMYREES